MRTIITLIAALAALVTHAAQPADPAADAVRNAVLQAEGDGRRVHHVTVEAKLDEAERQAFVRFATTMIEEAALLP
ncbi:MAG: hypothetical protein OXH09_23750 [Gammaproteobacteria bacterium]|nr:hypothetical protein [Gammaproteobacteria bacterium]